MDPKNMKPMTNWFSLKVLAYCLKRLLIAKTFGEFADRRLIQAALHPVNEDNIGKIKDEYHYETIKNNIKSSDKDNNKAIWIDYVADVGDGFDSTYSVAYLLGKDSIKVKRNEKTETLPRGNILIFGGDQVYPYASRVNYSARMLEPYSAAFPENDHIPSPIAYVLPGNHDWYDGLRLFDAYFCRGGEVGTQNKEAHYYPRIGGSNWSLPQRRSYFALKLPDNWWIFGIDTQLSNDIDQPQADYFKKILKKESNESDKNVLKKVIICVSAPFWLTADYKDEAGQDAYSRSIGYFVPNILRKAWGKDNFKVYCYLTGDLHNYNRYSSNITGSVYVTAGGGGAFLHPTHQLKEILNISDGKLTLEGCYPSKEESKKISHKNWYKFPFKHKLFSFLLGAIYGLMSMLIIALSHLDLYPVINFLKWTLIIATLFCVPFAWNKYHEHNYKNKSSVKIFGCGVFHGVIQWGVFAAGSIAFFLVDECITKGVSQSWCGFFSALSYAGAYFLISAAVGLISGLIFGGYMSIVSNSRFDSSFTEHGLETFKNFLRIKIEGDALTIYVIGINKPIRKWKIQSGKDIIEKIKSQASLLPDEDRQYYKLVDKIEI